jgi:hypothetical protein
VGPTRERRGSRLTPSEWTLIGVQGLVALGSAVAGIFLNLYIFDASGFEAVVVFQLVSFGLLYPMYIGSGYLLRVVSARGLIQAGTVLLGGLYAAVFLLGDAALGWLVPLAVVNGLGLGMYWSGVNVATYVETREATRTRFFARLSPVTTAASAGGPILGGAVIALASGLGHAPAGYAVVFAGLSLANLSAAALALRLEAHAGVVFSVRELFRQRHTPARLGVLAQQAVKGLWDSSFLTMWVLLLVSAVGSATLVSVVATAGARVYAVSSLAAGRLLSRTRRWSAFGGALVPVGVLVFGLATNGWLEAAAFVALIRLAGPFQDIPVQAIIFDTMDDIAGPWTRKFHHLIEREIALGGARVASLAIILAAFARGNDAGTAHAIVVGLAVCPLLVGVFQQRLDRRRRPLQPAAAAMAEAAPPV